MLNLLDITSNIRAVAIFVIIDLWKVWSIICNNTYNPSTYNIFVCLIPVVQ